MTNEWPAIDVPEVLTQHLRSLVCYNRTSKDYSITRYSVIRWNLYQLLPYIGYFVLIAVGQGFICRKAYIYLMPVQEIQLSPIPQTCALIALGIRKSFCSFANHCSPVSKCRHYRGHTEAGCVHQALPWRLRFLTVGFIA